MAYFQFQSKTQTEVTLWILLQCSQESKRWIDSSREKWESEQIDGKNMLSMSIQDMKDAGLCWGVACMLRERLPKLPTADNISSLIQILLLVASLLLTLAASLHTGVFTHEDLAGGDMRFFQATDNAAHGKPGQDCHFGYECPWLSSQKLQYHAVRAVFYFMFVIIFGMSISISFLLSDFNVGKVNKYQYAAIMASICCCYALEIVGMDHLFLANQVAVELKYPYYVEANDTEILHYGKFKDLNGSESFYYFPFTLVDGWKLTWDMRNSFYVLPPTVIILHFLIRSGWLPNAANWCMDCVRSCLGYQQRT